MPRHPRIVRSGETLHLVQRGNNRTACFTCDEDRVRYTHLLREVSKWTGCAVHAYVLMTNHVHVLLTASEAGSPSCMMQALGRRYVRYFNDRLGRTGTLWEGRFRSSVIDTERYYFHCSRYIETNPVRAGLVARPGDYRWSSHRCNAFGAFDALVTAHPLYRALGDRVAARCDAYLAMFASPLDARTLEIMRMATRSPRRSERASQQFGESDPIKKGV